MTPLQVFLEWVEADENWVLTGVELEMPLVVYPHELREQFPIYSTTATLLSSDTSLPVTFEDDLMLLGCAAYVLAFERPAQKRFHCYRVVVRYLGYRDRKQFPSSLERAIKLQWSNEDGAPFVSYQD